jgi:tetratricopeptide (TPR) repeat protein
VPNEIWRRRWLVGRVASLYNELHNREEVLTALRKEPALSELDRALANQAAQTLSEHPGTLNDIAWNVIKCRNASKDAYARALSYAETAVRLAPEEGHILNTLGVSQYRVGRYTEALTTLTKSEKLNAKGAYPDDLAFLAMTQHQLGKKSEAKATLDRLRQVMKPYWTTQDTEWAGFLREAEELIEGKAAGKGP